MLDRRIDVSCAAGFDRREQFLAAVGTQTVVRIERQNIGRVGRVEAGIAAKPEPIVGLVLQHNNAVEAGSVLARPFGGDT